MVFYTYKLVIPKTKQFYIGSRKAVKVNDPYLDLGIEYLSSSDAVKLIGFDNFIFGVISTYDDYGSCYWDEQKHIKENINNPLCLNKHYIDPNTLERRMFKTQPGVKRSDETKKKISVARTGVKRAPFDNLWKEKIGSASKQRWSNPEYKKRLREAHIGKKLPPRTEEWKNKQRESQKKTWAKKYLIVSSSMQSLN